MKFITLLIFLLCATVICTAKTARWQLKRHTETVVYVSGLIAQTACSSITLWSIFVEYSLAYGKGKVFFTLPKSIKPIVITPNEKAALPDPHKAASEAVENPMGTPPLAQMLREKAPKNVIVVVNDITRPTPYDVMLPPLLEAFRDAGIKDNQVTFLVATGIHDVHTEAQNRELYGDEIVDRFNIISHDAFKPETHTFMGCFKSGYKFYVNTLVKEADFLITLGVVMPHYFAGYSGGRKSILPGLAGKETVEKNHGQVDADGRAHCLWRGHPRRQGRGGNLRPAPERRDRPPFNCRGQHGLADHAEGLGATPIHQVHCACPLFPARPHTK